ncbi:hypothetical protein AB0F72_21650 [Actinoplanes sp. NPDC023936]|uniref:hypothetical protein n=1 Tax=Actinoplanes sp. NPDC023936 TaxID=3154910 RepID=UPI003409309D
MNEIELISDGDGLAVIGNRAMVERFLVSERLPAPKDLGMNRLSSILGTGAKAAKAASEISEKSGHWVKLSEQSAQAIQKYGLMKGSQDGLSRAVLTDSGKIHGLLEIVTSSPATMLANPAVLSGAAGLMAQLAMKQTMEEITEYLKVIDQKVDDVLRAQKDAVLADMIGVDLVIEEAMIIRDQVGWVSDVTWSKVQATPVTLTRTQAYALRQLDALAVKLEQQSGISDLARTSKQAESTIIEWLSVLARCFQLQDGIAVLELDRVLNTTPEELDRHRLALRTARQNRLELISHSTGQLLARLDAAATTANAKVLLNPASSRSLVHSRNHVTSAVVDFDGRLGIDRLRRSLRARAWTDAAAEVRDRALETGAEGVDVAWKFGKETGGRAFSAMGRLGGSLAERAMRQLGDNEKR